MVTEPDGGKAGSLQICNNAGKVKRDLSLSDIKGVEEASGIKDAEDAERAVSFRFAGSAKQAAADKSEDRTLVFVSKKQRDAFLEVMDRISPGSVVRKSDGSLGSSDKPGSGKGGKGGKGSGSSGGLDLESLGSGAKFFAMEENDWGYAEPRLLLFNDGGTDLRVIDAAFAGGPAAAVAAAVEYPLRRVVRVSLHLGDKSILQLAFSDGGLLATVAKTVVLTFGDRGNRERFLDTLRLVVHVGCGDASMGRPRIVWPGPLERRGDCIDSCMRRYAVLPIAAPSGRGYHLLPRLLPTLCTVLHSVTAGRSWTASW